MKLDKGKASPARREKMIYITGDTHGRFERVEQFCKSQKTKPQDILIILGDAGINFIRKRSGFSVPFRSRFSASMATMRNGLRPSQAIDFKNGTAVRFTWKRSILISVLPKMASSLIWMENER